MNSVESINRLAALEPSLLSSVDVVVIPAPGRIVVISAAIAEDLGYGGEHDPCS